MATHLRSQLRHAVANLLVNAVTADGEVVKISRQRVHAVSEDMLPAAFIICKGDDAESQNTRLPFLNDITVDWQVQLAVADATDVDDVIDDACLQIQHLVANANFTGLAGAKWTKYRGTDVEPDEQNQGVMRADLRFTTYFIAADNAVDVAL